MGCASTGLCMVGLQHASVGPVRMSRNDVESSRVCTALSIFSFNHRYVGPYEKYFVRKYIRMCESFCVGLLS